MVKGFFRSSQKQPARRMSFKSTISRDDWVKELAAALRVGQIKRVLCALPIGHRNNKFASVNSLVLYSMHLYRIQD